METNAEGGSTKYQAIVFQKQNGVGRNSGIPQQISASPDRRPPPSFPSLCSRALTSFPTHAAPRHSQNSWVKYKVTRTHFRTCIHTHATSLSLGALLRLSPLSTWHKTIQGIPVRPPPSLLPCAQRRTEVPVWVHGKCLDYMAVFFFLPLSQSWIWHTTLISRGACKSKRTERQQGVFFLLLCDEVNTWSIPWRVRPGNPNNK